MATYTDVTQKGLVINRMTLQQYQEIEPKEDELYVITDQPILAIDNDTIKTNNQQQLYCPQYAGPNNPHNPQQRGIIPEFQENYQEGCVLRGDGLWGFPEKREYEFNSVKVDYSKGKNWDRQDCYNLPLRDLQYAINLISRRCNVTKNIKVEPYLLTEEIQTAIQVPSIETTEYEIQVNGAQEGTVLANKTTTPIITVNQGGRISFNNISFVFHKLNAGESLPEFIANNYGRLKFYRCKFIYDSNAPVQPILFKNNGELIFDECEFTLPNYEVTPDCLIQSDNGEVTLKNSSITLGYRCENFQTDKHMNSLIVAKKSRCNLDNNSLYIKNKIYIDHIITGSDNCLCHITGKNWITFGPWASQQREGTATILNFIQLSNSKCYFDASGTIEVEYTTDNKGKLMNMIDCQTSDVFVDKINVTTDTAYGLRAGSIYGGSRLLINMEKSKFIAGGSVFSLGKDALSFAYDTSGVIQ